MAARSRHNIIVGVGAPSSLALTADRSMTLCGFARHGDVNVHTGPQRVAGPSRR
jgi:formate dehydrogenase assembly factor FdhD